MSHARSGLCLFVYVWEVFVHLINFNVSSVKPFTWLGLQQMMCPMQDARSNLLGALLFRISSTRTTLLSWHPLQYLVLCLPYERDLKTWKERRKGGRIKGKEQEETETKRQTRAKRDKGMQKLHNWPSLRPAPKHRNTSFTHSSDRMD